MIDPYPGKIGMALKCHQNLSVELLSKSTQFFSCLLWKIREAEEASIYLCPIYKSPPGLFWFVLKLKDSPPTDLWRNSWSTTSFQGFSPKCSDKNTESLEILEMQVPSAALNMFELCFPRASWKATRSAESSLWASCSVRGNRYDSILKILSLQKDMLGTKKCSHGLLIQDFHGFPTIYKMMFCMKNWKVIQDYFSTSCNHCNQHLAAGWGPQDS